MSSLRSPPKLRGETGPAPAAPQRTAYARPDATPVGRNALRASSRPSVSCVVPCLNEAVNLRFLLPRLVDVLLAQTGAWEIVLVDDGSTDDTPTLLHHWAQLPGFRLIQLSRNFGKEAALTAGMKAAVGDVVVLMDADGQHPPELIAEMLARWKSGADAVYAVRAHRRGESLYKRWGAKWFYALLNAADRFDVPAGAGDFRLMDRAVVDALLALPERNRFMKGLYAWVGFKTEEIPYAPPARASGRSRFGALQLLRLSMDGLTAFTTWPLRLVSLAGFTFAIPALLYGAYLTISYLLYGHPVSGWTTIVVSLLFFVGIQMISIGILGEYIARIFEEVKARPLYIVKRVAGPGMTAGKS